MYVSINGRQVKARNPKPAKWEDLPQVERLAIGERARKRAEAKARHEAAVAAGTLVPEPTRGIPWLDWFSAYKARKPTARERQKLERCKRIACDPKCWVGWGSRKGVLTYRKVFLTCVLLAEKQTGKLALRYSVETIGRHCGLTRDAAGRALAALVKAGMLGIDQRSFLPRDPRFSVTPATYRLTPAASLRPEAIPYLYRIDIFAAAASEFRKPWWTGGFGWTEKARLVYCYAKLTGGFFRPQANKDLGLNCFDTVRRLIEDGLLRVDEDGKVVAADKKPESVWRRKCKCKYGCGSNNPHPECTKHNYAKTREIRAQKRKDEWQAKREGWAEVHEKELAECRIGRHVNKVARWSRNTWRTTQVTLDDRLYLRRRVEAARRYPGMLYHRTYIRPWPRGRPLP